MKRLLLILPLLCLAAGDEEIKGWKIVHGNWSFENRVGICSGTSGLAQIGNLERRDVSVSITPTEILDPKAFRIGVFVGQTDTEWAKGKRIEIGCIGDVAQITLYDYDAESTRSVLSSQSLGSWKRLTIKIKCSENKIVANVNGKLLSCNLPYKVQGMPWGVIIVQGAAKFQVSK